MGFDNNLKKWAKGTPVGKFFNNLYELKSINYDAIDFSKKRPTLINRGIFKFSEFLWYAYGIIEKIVSEEDFMIVKFSINGDAIYLNVFKKGIIQNLLNLKNNKKVLIIIKTRVPFRPELPKFHELRYLKED